MRLKLIKLQIKNHQAKEIKVEIRIENTIKKGWKDVNKVLYSFGLAYVSEIIYIELISRQYNELLTSQLEIKKN